MNLSPAANMVARMSWILESNGWHIDTSSTHVLNQNPQVFLAIVHYCRHKNPQVPHLELRRETVKLTAHVYNENDFEIEHIISDGGIGLTWKATIEEAVEWLSDRRKHLPPHHDARKPWNPE